MARSSPAATARTARHDDTIPDQRLTLPGTIALQLEVSGASGSGVMVAGPGKVLCDDVEGARALDAQVADIFRLGEDAVDVGHPGQAATYRLAISEANRADDAQASLHG
ncbi:hypothetical protein [Luteimonas deserti]|uniref:Uncharacterized protein n=1 Tax=Luteimonas deserti TaxID=2752306 RepID=A0A7Z0QMJ7_9GAMM|nr:hypothetical protein [Luteimonas deserti]NYZ61407.1 hypothetical protein [Luteimonas deserti]